MSTVANQAQRGVFSSVLPQYRYYALRAINSAVAAAIHAAIARADAEEAEEAARSTNNNFSPSPAPNNNAPTPFNNNDPEEKKQTTATALTNPNTASRPTLRLKLRKEKEGNVATTPIPTGTATPAPQPPLQQQKPKEKQRILIHSNDQGRVIAVSLSNCSSSATSDPTNNTSNNPHRKRTTTPSTTMWPAVNVKLPKRCEVCLSGPPTAPLDLHLGQALYAGEMREVILVASTALELQQYIDAQCERMLAVRRKYDTVLTVPDPTAAPTVTNPAKRSRSNNHDDDDEDGVVVELDTGHQDTAFQPKGKQSKSLDCASDEEDGIPPEGEYELVCKEGISCGPPWDKNVEPRLPVLTPSESKALVQAGIFIRTHKKLEPLIESLCNSSPDGAVGSSTASGSAAAGFLKPSNHPIHGRRNFTPKRTVVVTGPTDDEDDCLEYEFEFEN